jgi:hypothetical protein
MTSSHNVPKSLSIAITDDLPRPDAGLGGVSSSTDSNTALPSSDGGKPNVTDAGRIRFGAGYRRPISKS